eukprot:m.1274211 g.1274211  ORF g.1274211 m.1274211 type:complete len:262 (+) comp24757_c0_seq17:169-954(+)
MAPPPTVKLSAWAQCWTWPPMFWAFIYGRIIYKVINYGFDIAFIAIQVFGTDFENSYGGDTKAVRSASVCVLVIGGLLLFISEWYLLNVKRRIHKVGLLSDPSYLYRISWTEFLGQFVAFTTNDIPEIVIFVIVSQATKQLDLLSILQLATTGASIIFFILLTLHTYCVNRDKRRDEHANTARRTGLYKEAAKAPMKDIKERNFKGKNTRTAIATAIKEPRRAKDAKQKFDAKEASVTDAFNHNPAIHKVVQPPKGRLSTL